MTNSIIRILKNFGIEETAITNDAHFMKDLGFDSLDTVDLMMQLEQEFDIVIPDEYQSKITTVGSLLRYLEDIQVFTF